MRCDLVVSLACLHLIFASIHSFIDLVNFVVRFGEIKNVCRIWQCSNIRTWCDISKKAIQRGADDERRETRENWWQAHSIEPTAKINCWINSVYAGCERAKIESVHTSNRSTTLKEWTKNDDAVGNESEFPNKCIGIYICSWKRRLKKSNKDEVRKERIISQRINSGRSNLNWSGCICGCICAFKEHWGTQDGKTKKYITEWETKKDCKCDCRTG